MGDIYFSLTSIFNISVVSAGICGISRKGGRPNRVKKKKKDLKTRNAQAFRSILCHVPQIESQWDCQKLKIFFNRIFL